MRYQRLMALGSGGMANVHLCLAVGHGGFKRLVVVKSVREELLGDPSMRQMFLAEAQVSARLNHPNVVHVSEVLDTGDSVMLVMEYLDGLAFSAACRAAGSAFTRAMRLRVMCDVLAGLTYAHDLVDYHGNPLGIVHRDVSPQNVFLTFDGQVKLLDFGIAKVTSAPDRTRAGVVKGRIAYMPIEQFTGKPVDRRTDVYAVGCLLWESIAGTRMWGQLKDPQIVRNLIEGKVPQLGSSVRVDPELERIVTKATAHRADDRYATAEELRLDLERYLGALPPVTPREIGELLSNVCADARAERKRVLTDAIATAERELSLQGGDFDVGSQQRLRIDDPTYVSGISKRSNSAAPVPSAYPHATPPSSSSRPSERSRSTSYSRAQRSRRGVWIVLGAAAAALAIAAWLPTLVRHPAPPNGAASRAPAATAPPAPAPSHLEDESKGESDAKAHVDSGASDSSRGPTPTAKSKHSHSHLVSLPIASAATPKTTAAHVDCNPPYYFSAGIKTFKPECI
jgi:serine/threonine-protein kinase